MAKSRVLTMLFARLLYISHENTILYCAPKLKDKNGNVQTTFSEISSFTVMIKCCKLDYCVYWMFEVFRWANILPTRYGYLKKQRIAPVNIFSELVYFSSGLFKLE